MASGTPEIRIYQAFYRPEQRAFLDPAFLPLDNTANPQPHLAEYYLFLRHVADGRHAGSRLTGVLSWKFLQKTHLRGERVLRFIAEHPGYDAYFFNPAPQHAEAFQSIWHHGEHYHPGLIDYAQRIFDEAGLPVRIRDLRNTEQDLLFCNYWVGTEGFWRAYMEFTAPVHAWFERHVSASEHAAQAAHHRLEAYKGRTGYYPFVMERMVSTLVAVHPELRVQAYRYPEEYRLLVKEAHGKEEALSEQLARTRTASARVAMRLARVPGVEPVARAMLWTGRAVRRLLR